MGALKPAGEAAVRLEKRTGEAVGGQERADQLRERPGSTVSALGNPPQYPAKPGSLWSEQWPVGPEPLLHVLPAAAPALHSLRSLHSLKND